MTLKQNLYHQCEDILAERLARIKQYIADIQEGLSSETKSSAGDKHETGRAMLQLEREKAGYQLAEVERLKTVLSMTSTEHRPGNIGLGSLVFTSKAHYFISLSLGALHVDDQTFYAISTKTPIGQLLLGKQVGDQLSFNGHSFVIKQVI